MMNQADLANVATQAAQQSKNIVARQVDRQAAAVGTTLTQTANDLKQVGSNLRDSGTIGGAAEVADWAAAYVTRAADYLSNGNTDRFITDAEAFARARPWAVAASAAALGFVAARLVKASSARRYVGAGDRSDASPSRAAVSPGFAPATTDTPYIAPPGSSVAGQRSYTPAPDIA